MDIQKSMQGDGTQVPVVIRSAFPATDHQV